MVNCSAKLIRPDLDSYPLSTIFYGMNIKLPSALVDFIQEKNPAIKKAAEDFLGTKGFKQVIDYSNSHANKFIEQVQNRDEYRYIKNLIDKRPQ